MVDYEVSDRFVKALAVFGSSLWEKLERILEQEIRNMKYLKDIEAALADFAAKQEEGLKRMADLHGQHAALTEELGTADAKDFDHILKQIKDAGDKMAAVTMQFPLGFKPGDSKPAAPPSAPEPPPAPEQHAAIVEQPPYTEETHQL